MHDCLADTLAYPCSNATGYIMDIGIATDCMEPWIACSWC